MQQFKLRYLITFFIFFLFYILFNIRSFELFFQTPLGDTNYRKKNVRRGIIYDRSGYVLAVSKDMVSVAIHPSEITNKNHTARLLAERLNLNYKKVLSEVRSKKSFIYLKRQIPHEDITDLARLKLAGVVFEKEPHRNYPNEKLAAPLIGFTGIDNAGLSGIEYQFNDVLTTDSDSSYIGNNIYLTINSFIQHKLESNLRAMMKKTKAIGAIGIMMNVHNGQILGMASLPSYDPNHPATGKSANYKNKSISNNFEPGSTFKIFTLASLMNENLFRENKTYFCRGYFEYKKHRVRCTGHHGEQKMRDIIKNSCNSGMIQASWQMPIGSFYENIRYFGFGTVTDIDLPGEARGFVPHPKKWDQYLKMTIPIGQGIGVTPIQLVTAASAIANGGYLIKPVIVSRIETSEGKTIQKAERKIRLKVTDPQKTAKLLNYLTYVVKEGTGHLANINMPGVSVCGKTGTSMISDDRKYLEGKYNASFLGFFPCNRPEIAIFIMIEQPGSGNYYGSTVAAPVFRKVLLDTIPLIHKGKIIKIPVKSLNKKSGISVHYSKKYPKNKMPNLKGVSKKEILYILNHYYPGEHVVSGAGYVVSTLPQPGTDIKYPYKFNIHFSVPSKTNY